MDKIKIGLIGFNRKSQMFYAQAFEDNPHSTLVGISTPDRKIGLETSRKYGIPWYSDYHDLLNREAVDAVYIASENCRHSEQILTNIKLKKHVLCENPIALSLEESNKILQVVESSTVRLYVPFRPRANATLVQMKNLVAQNGVGALRGIYFTMTFPQSRSLCSHSAQNDFLQVMDGSILDLGAHAFDYFLWLTNSKPTKVYAKVKKAQNGRNETAVITVRFSNDVIATAVTRWVGEEYFQLEESNIAGEMVIELLGHDRTVIMDAYHQRLSTYNNYNQVSFTYWGILEVKQAVMTFLDSIMDKDAIHTNIRDATNALKLVLAANKSIELGEPVYL